MKNPEILPSISERVEQVDETSSKLDALRKDIEQSNDLKHESTEKLDTARPTVLMQEAKLPTLSAEEFANLDTSTKEQRDLALKELANKTLRNVDPSQLAFMGVKGEATIEQE